MSIFQAFATLYLQRFAISTRIHLYLRKCIWCDITIGNLPSKWPTRKIVATALKNTTKMMCGAAYAASSMSKAAAWKTWKEWISFAPTANPHRKSPTTANPFITSNLTARGHSANTWNLLEHDDCRTFSKTENNIQRNRSLATKIFLLEKEQNRTRLYRYSPYHIGRSPRQISRCLVGRYDGAPSRTPANEKWNWCITEQTLTRRLEMWQNGQFEDLFDEAKALQLRLKRSQTKQRDIFREFVHHVTSGKIRMR